VTARRRRRAGVKTARTFPGTIPAVLFWAVSDRSKNYQPRMLLSAGDLNYYTPSCCRAYTPYTCEEEQQGADRIANRWDEPAGILSAVIHILSFGACIPCSPPILISGSSLRAWDLVKVVRARG
jgi:hypothetical protein